MKTILPFGHFGVAIKAKRRGKSAQTATPFGLNDKKDVEENSGERAKKRVP